MPKKASLVFSFQLCKSFISFHDMICKSGTKYPFVIMNTDGTNKKGTHRWSFLNLYPKKEIFMFDSFGFKVFKEFVIEDDQKIINKIFYGV